MRAGRRHTRTICGILSGYPRSSFNFTSTWKLHSQERRDTHLRKKYFNRFHQKWLNSKSRRTSCEPSLPAATSGWPSGFMRSTACTSGTAPAPGLAPLPSFSPGAAAAAAMDANAASTTASRRLFRGTRNADRASYAATNRRPKGGHGGKMMGYGCVQGGPSHSHLLRRHPQVGKTQK